jgi:4-hydroxy-3-methylbut-2-en-1-yl diphosphate synthase IspG/GcpE
MCSVLGCYEVHTAQHIHTECPRCGITRAEVLAFKTNDPKVINDKKVDLEIAEFYNDSLGG